KHLFKGKSLQDLPTDQAGPRFVINATNVQTGVLWRFSRPYMADYLVGQIMNPDVPLAQAVAASSAFPPLLSPVILKVNPEEFEPSTLGPFGEKGGAFTRRIVLTDGGVYDNLGLETAFKRYRTLLVSNAGGQMTGRPRPRRNWLSHTYRIFNIVDNQVRSLRKRQLLDSYTTEATSRKRLGAYWSIRSNIADYGLQDTLPCPQSDALRLAATPTRLKKLDESLQRQLINWGYAICDAAIRRYWDPEGSISPPDKFPYAGGIDGK
ncbi:MAG: patatin-like phospholipase family protein, partial [Phycisphaerae bacterium]|nr:patatin-like phospholipase family protein [Phycisphaerae bacterium]